MTPPYTVIKYLFIHNLPQKKVIFVAGKGKDSIDFGPKREKFHFSEANISRTKRSRGMISTLLESGFQPFSKRVEDNLLELLVLEIIWKGKPILARSRCCPSKSTVISINRQFYAHLVICHNRKCFLFHEDGKIRKSWERIGKHNSNLERTGKLLWSQFYKIEN